MSIFLGNLTIDDMENRTGVKFPVELREMLEQSHQDEASNVAEGKWHCFDIPFFMVCGGRPMAQRVYDLLKADAGKFKQPLQIGLSPNNKASDS